MTAAAKAVLAAAALAAAAGCGPAKAPVQETRPDAMKIRQQFDALYSRWQEHLDSPRIADSSRPSDMIGCESYRKIAALGRPALPLLIAKMREGDSSGWKEAQFFLWHAARDISGVDLSDEGKTVGEKAMARKYIRWFDESEGRR